MEGGYGRQDRLQGAGDHHICLLLASRLDKYLHVAFVILYEVEMPNSVSYHGPIALAKAVANVQRTVSKALPSDKQQAAEQPMIEVVRPWTICRWTESRLASGIPLEAIPTEIIHQITLEWTPEEQEHLAAMVKSLKEQALTDIRGGVAWRVHRCQLACFSFSLEEEGDRDGDSRWWEERNTANFVVGPVFRLLRDFVGDHMTRSATIPFLNYRQQHSINPIPSPLPQKAVIFCLLAGQVRHVHWWLRQNFG